MSAAAADNPSVQTDTESQRHNYNWAMNPIKPFVVTPSSRTFFTSYYRSVHQRELTDADIVQLVSAAQDRAMKTCPYPCVQEYKFSYPVRPII
jgi:hypothetical protein